ncbi:MAG: outer membrane protein assembly factor BamE [Maritimibacter sp.]
MTVLRKMLALVALVAVAACTPIYRYHGFVPTDEDLEEIEVGLDTRASVASAESAWYYVRSEFKHEGPYAPEETDRQVVAISFDEDDVVENIERFGLERGQVVVLSRRVTDSNIAGVSFLRQLFGGASGAANIAQFFN